VLLPPASFSPLLCYRVLHTRRLRVGAAQHMIIPPQPRRQIWRYVPPCTSRGLLNATTSPTPIVRGEGRGISRTTLRANRGGGGERGGRLAAEVCRVCVLRSQIAIISHQHQSPEATTHPIKTRPDPTRPGEPPAAPSPAFRAPQDPPLPAC